MKGKSVLKRFLCLSFVFFVACNLNTSVNRLKILEGVWYYEEGLAWGSNETDVCKALGMSETDFEVEPAEESVIIDLYSSDKEGMSWEGLPIKQIELAFGIQELTTGEKIGLSGITICLDANKVSIEQVNDMLISLYGMEKQELKEQEAVTGHRNREVLYQQSSREVEAYEAYRTAVDAEYKAWGYPKELGVTAVGISLNQVDEKDIYLSWYAPPAAIYNHVAAR